jgi:hypothetical protein
MIVMINIGRLYFLFDPFTINNTIKFFRFTKYQDGNDMEAYQKLHESDENST